MKEIITVLVNNLLRKKEITMNKCAYSLTINLETVIPYKKTYQRRKFTKDSKLEVAKALKNVEDNITSYNLTLEFEFKDSRHLDAWYKCEFVFYGGDGVNKFDFSFMSNKSNISQLNGYGGLSGNYIFNQNNISGKIDSLIALKKHLVESDKQTRIVLKKLCSK